MVTKQSGFRHKFLTSIILVFCIWSFVPAQQSIDDDDFELHMEITDGSVIFNESPTVVKPMQDYIIQVGTKDTIVGKMTEIFSDLENGSQLNYSARSDDRNLIRVGLNPNDSSIVLFSNPQGQEGNTSVILTASDGLKEVSDTFAVRLIQRIDIQGIFTDTIVKKGKQPLRLERDISNVIPNTIHDDVTYSVEVKSKNENVIRVSAQNDSSLLFFDGIDSAFGSSVIKVQLTNNFGFSSTDSFVVTVIDDIDSSKYYRKKEVFNPGISLFSSVDYSGIGVKIWLFDLIGLGLNGYYHWDQTGVGGDLQLLIKPHLQSFIQPFAFASVGYHRQTITQTFPEHMLTVDKDIPVLVARGGGGIDFWLGKKRQQVIGVEAGYVYGTQEYELLTSSEVGSNTTDLYDGVFEMPKFHLRVAYTFYFKPLHRY